jgi:hypothetical protein
MLYETSATPAPISWTPSIAGKVLDQDEYELAYGSSTAWPAAGDRGNAGLGAWHNRR